MRRTRAARPRPWPSRTDGAVADNGREGLGRRSCPASRYQSVAARRRPAGPPRVAPVASSASTSGARRRCCLQITVQPAGGVCDDFSDTGRTGGLGGTSPARSICAPCSPRRATSSSGPVVAASDLKGLRALAEEKTLKPFLCVSMEPRSRLVDGIQILPWAEFLDGLAAGRFDST